MARREVIQSLSAGLFGLGDRLRSGAQQEQQNAIQKRYLGLAESKMQEELKRAQKAEAVANFNEMAQNEAIGLLQLKGVQVNNDNVMAVMPEAKKIALTKISHGTKAMLGPDIQSALGSKIGAVGPYSVVTPPPGPKLNFGAQPQQQSAQPTATPTMQRLYMNKAGGY